MVQTTTGPAEKPVKPTAAEKPAPDPKATADKKPAKQEQTWVEGHPEGPKSPSDAYNAG